ncbi:phage holin family protein [Flindersiella endophytica]
MMPPAEPRLPDQGVHAEGGPGLPASQPDDSGESIGSVLADITQDLQTLFRQEVDLAKAEFREEGIKAAKAASLVGAAGFAGYMVVVLLSLAAVFGLANVLGLDWSALIVAGLWAVAGLILFVTGRGRMREVSVTPERTTESLKEDAEWLRNPTG